MPAVIASPGFVFRTMVTPPIVIDTDALAVKTPVVLELIRTVQVAVRPPLLIVGDPQVVLCEDGAGVTVGVMTNDGVPAPEETAVAVTVNRCDAPTGFTASGVIEIAPSIHRFVRSPLPPAAALMAVPVSRVIDSPSTV